MLYSCTHMATVGFKGLTNTLKNKMQLLTIDLGILGPEDTAYVLLPECHR